MQNEGMSTVVRVLSPLVRCLGPTLARAEAVPTSLASRARSMSGMTFIAESLQQNQFAQGGLVLAAVGLLAAAAKSLGEVAIEYTQRKLFVQMEIDSRDDAYRWMMVWLAQHPSFRDSPRVSVTTSLTAFGSSGLEGSLVGSKKVMLLPAPGDHVLNHQRRWVWISRKRPSVSAAASVSSKVAESIQVSAWGHDRAILEDMLAQAYAAYTATTRQRTVIYSMTTDGYWDRIGSRPLRPMSTVVLPGDQAAALLADCQQYLDSEAWYAHHGIPYRRGYLLYGVPGSGKTSLVTALAGSLAMDIYVVTLSSPAMTDETLRQLLNTAGEKCCLLLEDVDAAFVGREGQAGGTAGAITFSGLLNAIDGVAAQEGRLLFMTTNHINRLSSALIRPGRVDVRVEFSHATKDQAARLFMSFYDPSVPQHLGSPLTQPDTQWTQQLGQGQGQGQGVGQEQGQEQGQGQSSKLQVAGTAQAPESACEDATTDSSSSAGNDAATLPQACVSRAKASAVSPAQLQHLAREFAAAVPEGLVSMAAMQGYLMSHRHEPGEAVAGVQAWLTSLKAHAAGSQLQNQGSGG
ncbi:BCS1 N terminal-domain-containing protein [Haematococcus lacustris]